MSTKCTALLSREFDQRFYLFLFLMLGVWLALPSVLRAESVRQDWISRQAGGSPASITLDSAGNIYLTGTGGSTVNSIETVKYNSTGNKLWSSEYNIGSQNYGTSLIADPSENVYVTGTSWYGQNWEITTIKYDPNGNQIWVSRYSTNAIGYNNPIGIVLDATGNVIVAGTSPVHYR
jgi:hypothetical protein